MAQATTANVAVQAPAAPQAGAANPAANKTGPAATAQPTPTEIRKLKLKLDGQEIEMPESEVIERAQREAGSSRRFQEASALRKQAEEVIAFAKSNPKEFFAKTGMNARQWAEEYLMEELKREQMSPEQKKAADNEALLKKYEDEKKQAKKLQDDKDHAELQKKHHDNYEKIFVEALGKSGLPKTPYTIKRMAELMLTNRKLKLDLGADQLTKLVREDYIAEQKALFGSMEGDPLMEMLGPEIMKKLSQAQIAKLKAKGVKATSAATGNRVKTDGNQALTWREYQKRNRGRA